MTVSPPSIVHAASRRTDAIRRTGSTGASNRVERLAVDAVRRRGRLGEAHLELRSFPVQRASQVRVGATAAVLLCVIHGAAEIVGESGRVSIAAGEAAFLARTETMTVVWHGGSRGLVVYLPRHRLQAMASSAHGGARRLSTATRCLPIADNDTSQVIADIVDSMTGVPLEAVEERLLEGRLNDTLLAALAADTDVAETFPLVRAVTTAIGCVTHQSERPWDAATLAAASGVTAPVLRRGFRAHLGVTISAFVQHTRLDRARQSLASGCDSRSLTAVALSAGFQTASAFSRAYHHQFGESPSHTRARAVRKIELEQSPP